MNVCECVGKRDRERGIKLWSSVLCFRCRGRNLCFWTVLHCWNLLAALPPLTDVTSVHSWANWPYEPIMADSFKSHDHKKMIQIWFKTQTEAEGRGRGGDVALQKPLKSTSASHHSHNCNVYGKCIQITNRFGSFLSTSVWQTENALKHMRWLITTTFALPANSRSDFRSALLFRSNLDNSYRLGRMTLIRGFHTTEVLWLVTLSLPRIATLPLSWFVFARGQDDWGIKKQASCFLSDRTFPDSSGRWREWMEPFTERRKTIYRSANLDFFSFWNDLFLRPSV